MNINPFKSAKILGTHITYEQYSQQPDGVKRGDPRFIMTRSQLMEFVECPMKWLNAEPEEESTKALDYGTLIDCLVMMPAEFDNLFVIRPEVYPASDGTEKPWSGNAKWCKDWLEKNSDRIPITKTIYEESQLAVAALHRDRIAHEYISCSQVQMMVESIYKDADTGVEVPVRVLTDLVPDPKHPMFGKSVGDFKTGTDGSPRNWSKHVEKYGYDVQAALNLDIHSVVNPDVERIEFRHVVQESSKPFQTGRRILTEDFIEIGRAKYLAALKLYCKCLKYQFWPDWEIGANISNGWSFTAPRPWMLFDSLEYQCVFPQEEAERKKHEAENPQLNIDTTP